MIQRLTRPALGATAALGLLLGGTALNQSHGASTAHAVTAQPTDVALAANICSNVALTWPAGTPVATVAAAVAPADAVEAIWHFVNEERRFVAWSPIAGAPNDYTGVRQRLEAVFICTRGAATLTRPGL